MSLRSAVVSVFCAVGLLGAAMVATSSEAAAGTVITKISLADFKRIYGLSSVRGRVSNGGNGVTVWVKRFRNKHGKVDLTKSFLYIRVRTPPAVDPVYAEFTFRVQRKPFAANNPSEPLTCSVKGTTSGGAHTLTCDGISVSPS